MVNRHRASLQNDEEANKAAWEAARGAGIGATKWGAFFALAGGIAYAVSPIYRGFTFQFKLYSPPRDLLSVELLDHPQHVSLLHTIPDRCPHTCILTTPNSYIQMSGMILGGMIEADRRMIAYEHQVRHQKRMARDMEVWRKYEEDYERSGTPGVGAESSVKGKQED